MALCVRGGLFSPRNKPSRYTAPHYFFALAVGLVITLLYGGRCYWRNWEWRSGHDIWRGVVQLNPLNPHAVHNYGLELSWAGRQAEAVRVLARSVELNPTGVGNLHPLGLALRLDGRCDDAVELARDGIHLGWRMHRDNLMNEGGVEVAGGHKKPESMLDNVGRLFCILAYCHQPPETVRRCQGGLCVCVRACVRACMCVCVCL